MTPHIRRIRAEEWRQLRTLRLRALADAPMAFGSTLARELDYSDDIWRERAEGASAGCDRATFIAERDGRWVGSATCLAQLDKADSEGPLLVDMFVDTAERRAGVGAALVEAVCGWAQSCGAGRITLWATSGNDPAVALYRRCGFRATGAARPLAHTPTVNECEMTRDLR
jgi:GNAT superfamily N-acetyltransferase